MEYFKMSMFCMKNIRKSRFTNSTENGYKKKTFTITQVVKITSPPHSYFFTLGEKFFEWKLGGEPIQKNLTILDAVFQNFLQNSENFQVKMFR